MKIKIFKKKAKDYFLDINAFGLTESIISIVILTTIIAYSLAFVTKRQSSLYEANLTSAINDEINRDIETIKNSLWQEHFIPRDTKLNKPAKYDIGGIFCSDVINTFKRFTNTDFSWTPGSNTGNYQGQKRNKIFTGRPVIIKRKIITVKPLGLGSSTTMDSSIAKIVYIVNRNNQDIHWTSLDLTTEAHSWCSKN